MKLHLIFTDGGSRGNPGPAACGWIIYTIEIGNNAEASKKPHSSGKITSYDDFMKAFKPLIEGKEATGLSNFLNNYKTNTISGNYYLGNSNTNNQAEWMGIIKALESLQVSGQCKNEDKPNIILLADSLLAIKQLKGEYKVKNAGLKPYYAKAKNLLLNFNLLYITHIYRTLNKEADSQVNICLDSLE